MIKSNVKVDQKGGKIYLDEETITNKNFKFVIYTFGVIVFLSIFIFTLSSIKQHNDFLSGIESKGNSNIKELDAEDSGQSDGLTNNSNDNLTWAKYYNGTHGYKLEYPSTWNLILDDANNIENYDSSNCCNQSKLIITNGETEWIFLLDILYTGGEGLSVVDYHDTCFFNNDPETPVCSIKNYDKDIVVFDKNLQKKGLIENSSGEIIKIQIGENIAEKEPELKVSGKYPQYTSPVFIIENKKTFQKLSSDKPRYASITYEGENIAKNISTLDRITQSLKWEN